MDENFKTATRVYSLACESLITDLIGVLHGLAPEKIESLHNSTVEQLNAAHSSTEQSLLQLRHSMLDAGIEISRRNQR